MEVSIKQLGFNNINYSVRMTIDGQEKMFRNFTRKNDTLIHVLQGNDFFKAYIQNDFLVFLSKENQLKREVAWEIVPYSFRKNHLDFFIFDTVSYPNGHGDVNDSYGHFFYPINNEFLKFNRIDSLKILTVDSAVKAKKVDYKTGYLNCYFNKEGYLDSMISFEKRLTFRYAVFKNSYFRNKSNPHKLDSTIMQSVVLKISHKAILYDTDNWRLDEGGQKLLLYEKSWEINNQGYPVGFVLQNPNKTKYKFEYEGNRLVKVSTIDTCGTNTSTEYVYNLKGVPVKLIFKSFEK